MSILAQAREGRRILIDANPVGVVPYRRALASDGYGGLARTGALEAQARARIRICFERSGVHKNEETPAGLGTSLSLFAMTDHSKPLLEGDEFTVGDYVYVVGAINDHAVDGGYYGYDAVLTRTKTAPVTIPGAFAAAAVSDTEIDLTWTDTGAVNTYAIERRTGAEAFSVIATPAAGALVYHDTGLTAATAYTYRIRAYSGSTPSAYSPEASATTEEATP